MRHPDNKKKTLQFNDIRARQASCSQTSLRRNLSQFFGFLWHLSLMGLLVTLPARAVVCLGSSLGVLLSFLSSRTKHREKDYLQNWQQITCIWKRIHNELGAGDRIHSWRARRMGKGGTEDVAENNQFTSEKCGTYEGQEVKENKTVCCCCCSYIQFCHLRHSGNFLHEASM